MSTTYHITVAANNAERAVTLLLDGKIDEDALPALAESLARARKTRGIVYLDLSEVTLIDREAVRFLSQQAAVDVKLINCPPYLRRWMPEADGETGGAA